MLARALLPTPSTLGLPSVRFKSRGKAGRITKLQNWFTLEPRTGEKNSLMPDVRGSNSASF